MNIELVLYTNILYLILHIIDTNVVVVYENDDDVMSSFGKLEASPANTHIIEHSGKLLALEETHLPWEVDIDLNTVGVYDFSGELNGAMTAHPRVCPETGELLFFGYSMMGDPFLTFTKSMGAEVDKSGRGLGIRSNRYTMLIEDNKILQIQEEKETGMCEISAAENFLNLI